MGNSVRFKASMDDQVTGRLGKIRDQFDRLGKSKGAMSILQGVGVGVGVAAYGLLQSAIGGVTNALADGVRGAIDEEASIARMTAALKANVSGWDGNTDAIDKATKSRMKLGFADDDLRDSMSRIIPATNDVNAALRVQRTAMDLARLKGIDLATASDALVKVEAGQYRMLKSLGIELRAGATSTEALAAVQRAANGQAEAYAQTISGRLVVAQERFNEQMEELGAKTLPAVSDGLEGVNRLFDSYKLPIEDQYRMNDAIGQSGDFIDDFIDSLTAWDTFSPAVWDRQVKSVEYAQKALVEFRASERESLGDAGAALQEFGAISDDTKDGVVSDNRKIKRSYRETADYLLDQYTDNYDTAMGVIEARSALNAAKTDQDRVDALADLAAMGALSTTGYEKWIAALERLAKGTKGKVHESFMAAIADVRALKAAAQGEIKVKVSYTTSGKAPKPGQAAEPRAGGGPVTAHQPYIVGEDGPELFVPKSSGTVIPNEPTEMLAATPRLPGGASGSPVVVQLVMDGREIARVVDRHLYYEAARAPRAAS